MKVLEGKVAIVTGAGSGVGKAIALILAENGASVMLADLHQENIEAVAGEIKGLGGSSNCLSCDISRSADAALLVEETIKIFGTADILVNNAGVMDGFTAAGNTSDELWNKVMGTNLYGAFFLSREVISIFLEKGEGSIINIASVAGLHGGRAGAAYTASKHAVIGLTRNISYTYANKNIRCNAIAPGGLTTNLSLGTEPDPFGFDRMNAGAANMPPEGSPDDIAQLVLFLADKRSVYINGAVICADGGWTAY